MVGDLAATAEAAGWDGFFVWDHLQYGERVTAIADAWTCCAAVAMRSETLLFGPMVTPLPRRRPAGPGPTGREPGACSRAAGSCSAWGWATTGWESSAPSGTSQTARVRGRMLDEGLGVLTALLSGGPVDHDGAHYAVREVHFRPAPDVPIWLAGRFGNRAPLRRAARHDGFFVIGLDRPDDLAEVTADLAEQSPAPGFELVVDLRPQQDPTPWLDRGASWVLTRIGPFDLDLAEVRRIVEAGP